MARHLRRRGLGVDESTGHWLVGCQHQGQSTDDGFGADGTWSESRCFRENNEHLNMSRALATYETETESKSDVWIECGTSAPTRPSPGTSRTALHKQVVQAVKAGGDRRGNGATSCKPACTAAPVRDRRVQAAPHRGPPEHGAGEDGPW